MTRRAPLWSAITDPVSAKPDLPETTLPEPSFPPSWAGPGTRYKHTHRDICIQMHRNRHTHMHIQIHRDTHIHTHIQLQMSGL